MMKLIYSLPFLFALIACKKQEEISLSEHLNVQIACEGIFTDQNDRHVFDFSLSKGIGYTPAQPFPPTGLSMTLTTPTELITFSEIEPAKFKSDTPFAGEYGASYTINFIYEGTIHTAKTEMPKLVEIDSIRADSSFIHNNYTGLPVIYTYLHNSTSNQYMRFELYTRNDIDSSNWIQLHFPIYRIIELPVGENIRVTVPIQSTDILSIIAGTEVKIKTYLLSSDIGEYLKSISDYANTQLSSGQDYNPPYFFTNKAFGLCYGTKSDSAIITF